MTSALIIDEKKLEALRKNGESKFIDINEMKKIVSGDAAPIGERGGYECDLDFGYRVVFSIEEHPLKDGGTTWLRHMSMSAATPGKAPNQVAVGEVGGLLGFPTKDHELDYDKCQFWLEDGEAVNVICEIEKPCAEYT